MKYRTRICYTRRLVSWPGTEPWRDRSRPSCNSAGLRSRSPDGSSASIPTTRTARCHTRRSTARSSSRPAVLGAAAGDGDVAVLVRPIMIFSSPRPEHAAPARHRRQAKRARRRTTCRRPSSPAPCRCAARIRVISAGRLSGAKYFSIQACAARSFMLRRVLQTVGLPVPPSRAASGRAPILQECLCAGRHSSYSPSRTFDSFQGRRTEHGTL